MDQINKKSILSQSGQRLDALLVHKLRELFICSVLAQKCAHKEWEDIGDKREVIRVRFSRRKKSEDHKVSVCIKLKGKLEPE